MTKIVTLLTNEFADWETTLLNAVGKGFYGFETAYATPDGKPVTSVGGMKVTPDMALGDVKPEDFDALVICGGGAWKQPGAPDITDAAKRFHDAKKVVAGICDGTFALAKTGLLDTVAHTSNGAGYLDETGYHGKAHYRDTPEAVTDRKIVTAPGTAPVSFMAAVMKALGVADDQLQYYVGLHAAQYGGAANAKAA
jgi:putative intracellular protease/amidase